MPRAGTRRQRAFQFRFDRFVRPIQQGGQRLGIEPLGQSPAAEQEQVLAADGRFENRRLRLREHAKRSRRPRTRLGPVQAGNRGKGEHPRAFDDYRLPRRREPDGKPVAFETSDHEAAKDTAQGVRPGVFPVALLHRAIGRREKTFKQRLGEIRA